MHGRSIALTMAALIGVIAGCGSDGGSASDAARSVEIATVEYSFVAKESITIEAGETIEFVVTNEGEIDHEMEVLTGANRTLGKTERIAPGDTDTVVVTFDEAGLYRVICDIDDHRSLGQEAEFTVVAPSDDET